MFGDGLAAAVSPDGRAWRPAAGALDIVAHEISHAVLDASAGLVYRRESGALSEAFADIMAVAVERSNAPRAEEAGAVPGTYLLGENAVDGGLRSLATPGAHGFAGHYARRVIGADDNGGVHANALIAGHAFYLAVEGGRHAWSGLTVEGVGADRRADVEKVFYRAFVYMLPSNATFAAARAATLQSAVDLFGAGSAVERAVAQAWSAVGVE
jgi:Zn-dependent metalloprotease